MAFFREEYAQDEYPYGIIKLECKEVPEVEVNAHAFPKGRIGIRYRVLVMHFLGTPILMAIIIQISFQIGLIHMV